MGGFSRSLGRDGCVEDDSLIFMYVESRVRGCGDVRSGGDGGWMEGRSRMNHGGVG